MPASALFQSNRLHWTTPHGWPGGLEVPSSNLGAPTESLMNTAIPQCERRLQCPYSARTELSDTVAANPYIRALRFCSPRRGRSIAERSSHGSRSRPQAGVTRRRNNGFRMADRAGGGGPARRPPVGWALPNWVTALTYQPWTLLPSSPLSPNTTNRCTFDAQFARILMWPPSVFRGGRPKLAWGTSRPATFMGVWFPGGRARERLASRDHGGNGLRLGVGRASGLNLGVR